MFWSYPFFPSVTVPNDVSQARDFHSSERNFLTAIKCAGVLALAGGALLLHTKERDATPADWVFSVMLLVLGLVFPVLALLNYVNAAEAYAAERQGVHAQWFFTGGIIAACTLVVAINIHELCRQ